MGTKARLRFLNRAARFDGDIEFVDVIYTAVRAGTLTTGDGVLFDGVTASAHPRLAGQRPTDDNRVHVAAHLRKSVWSSYIKDLYEDFSEYLAEIVRVCRGGFKPDRITGNHTVSVDAREILNCGTWDGVVDLVTESVFRRLSGLSNTRRLVQALDDLLGLAIDPNLVDAAQPYVELRHLLVHTDGVASREFCESFPAFGAYAGDSIRVSADTVRDARAAITALVEHIDRKAIEAGLVLVDDLQ